MDALHQPMGMSLGGQRTPVMGANMAPFGTFGAGIGGLLGFLGATVTTLVNELLVTLAGGSGGAYYDFPVRPGIWVHVEVDARRVTAAQAALRVYDGAAFTDQVGAVTTTSLSAVPLVVEVVPESTTLRVYLEASGSLLNTAAFDNLEVREILG